MVFQHHAVVSGYDRRYDFTGWKVLRYFSAKTAHLDDPLKHVIYTIIDGHYPFSNSARPMAEFDRYLYETQEFERSLDAVPRTEMEICYDFIKSSSVYAGEMSSQGIDDVLFGNIKQMQ